ncbi:MAG: hypothetical protein FWC93_03175, partial [Defluviitaleaceae bacterium]|nr:hypothetical protein [Defluviitaleaceae bacterium]
MGNDDKKNESARDDIMPLFRDDTLFEVPSNNKTPQARKTVRNTLFSFSKDRVPRPPSYDWVSYKNADDATGRRRPTGMDTLFLLTVGTFLAWSLAAGVISGTVFVLVPFVMFIRVFFVLGLLRLVFINKHTLISAAAVVGVAFVFMLIGVLAYNPDVAHGNTPVFFRLIDFVSSVVSFVTGFEPYQAVYGTFIQWSV